MPTPARTMSIQRRGLAPSPVLGISGVLGTSGVGEDEGVGEGDGEGVGDGSGVGVASEATMWKGTIAHRDRASNERVTKHSSPIHVERIRRSSPLFRGKQKERSLCFQGFSLVHH